MITLVFSKYYSYLLLKINDALSFSILILSFCFRVCFFFSCVSRIVTLVFLLNVQFVILNVLFVSLNLDSQVRLC